MHEELIRYIRDRSVTPMSDDNIASIKAFFVPKKFRRKQYFSQADEISKNLAFIVKGAMRQYSIDAKGIEHVVRLSIENWWAGDRESLSNQAPSRYFIDCWEDTDALVISRADMSSLTESIPAFSEMTRVLDEKHAFALLNRVNASISLSAEERYADLEKSYPEFLQRFPQHIIASYLGVTKETRSRVRKQSSKR